VTITVNGSHVITLTNCEPANDTLVAPWSATEDLMTGAGKVLPPGGVLYLYGPFQENCPHTASSNEARCKSQGS
jgi:hypothetical protein